MSDVTLPRPHRLRARLARVCLKIKTLRDATRVWNWIDGQADADQLWPVLQSLAPWAFEDDRDANTIRFTYTDAPVAKGGVA